MTIKYLVTYRRYEDGKLYYKQIITSSIEKAWQIAWELSPPEWEVTSVEEQ